MEKEAAITYIKPSMTNNWSSQVWHSFWLCYLKSICYACLLYFIC